MFVSNTGGAWEGKALSYSFRSTFPQGRKEGNSISCFHFNPHFPCGKIRFMGFSNCGSKELCSDPRRYFKQGKGVVQSRLHCHLADVEAEVGLLIRNNLTPHGETDEVLAGDKTHPVPYRSDPESKEPVAALS